MLCLEVVICKGPQHFDTGLNSEDTIISPTSGLRVQMGAYECRRPISYTRTDGKDISNGIYRDVAPEAPCRVDEPISSLFIRVRQAESRHARFIRQLAPSLAQSPLACMVNGVHEAFSVDLYVQLILLLTSRSGKCSCTSQEAAS